MVRSRLAHVDYVYYLAGLLLVAAVGCGQGAAPSGHAAPLPTGALTAADQTHNARATAYAAKAAHYRDVAAAQRQRATDYARWAPKLGPTVDTRWNEELKAANERRAAAAEQIATAIQEVADFHTAEANKEGGR